jgi:hypothetical protein
MLVNYQMHVITGPNSLWRTSSFEMHGCSKALGVTPKYDLLELMDCQEPCGLSKRN